eukprot:Blabericola_migrator_1__12889@NODE_842_length_6289_cov_33_263742_g594_i0_p2_GENE_NODE_842_length_6289_cov_33_263742_g594_i0NODE_842_length_6289_cov_33_263742_g594_i0_p2_ORF_typecomplete_len462_score42_04_NODE_842_length_6289_cov_33_263742_g594_i046526037
MRGIEAQPQSCSSNCQLTALALIAIAPPWSQGEPLDLTVLKKLPASTTETDGLRGSAQDGETVEVSCPEGKADTQTSVDDSPPSASVNTRSKRSAEWPASAMSAAKASTSAERGDTVAANRPQTRSRSKATVASRRCNEYSFSFLASLRAWEAKWITSAGNTVGTATNSTDDLAKHDQPAMTSSDPVVSPAALIDGTTKKTRSGAGSSVNSVRTSSSHASPTPVTVSQIPEVSTEVSCNETLYKKYRAMYYRVRSPTVNHETFLKEWGKKVRGSELVTNHYVYLRRCECHTFCGEMRHQIVQQATKLCSRNDDRDLHFIADYIKLMLKFPQRQKSFELIRMAAATKKCPRFSELVNQMRVMCDRYPFCAEAIAKEVRRKEQLYAARDDGLPTRHVFETLPEIFKEPQCGRWLQAVDALQGSMGNDLVAFRTKEALLRLLASAGHILQFMREFQSSSHSENL